MSAGGVDETQEVDPTEPRSATDERLGRDTRLAGRYEILDVLGHGGMGVVYLAADHALGGKPVALKIVAGARARLADLEGLRREVLLAQQVTHRNVCRIYDLEQGDGRWMIKMEHVEGETLAARLARGPLSIAEAVAITREIADGLAAAHAQGVIHRDLKPANVMVEAATGRVVLMDFGIAREVTGGGTDPDVAGTPAYMAPEQVRAEAPGPAADVYALGCVLYHLVVGEVVFPAATAMAAGLRHVEDPAPDPRRRRADVPAWLAGAILAMLAKDPARRPAGAAAVRRLLDGPVPRRRLRIGLALGVAGALLAAAIAWRATRPARSTPAWRPTIEDLMPGHEDSGNRIGISPDGAWLAYDSERNAGANWRVYVHPLTGGGGDRAITGRDESAFFLDWTRDGAILFAYDQDPGVYRVDTHGGAPVRLTEAVEAVACGDRLLLVRSSRSGPDCAPCGRLVLRDEGGREQEVARLDGYVYYARCDRAGTRAVYVQPERVSNGPGPEDLWLIDLATGARRRLTRDGRRNTHPVFTPDRDSVVFSSAAFGDPQNLWELSLAGGDPVQLTFGRDNDLAADLSADGRRLVFMSDTTIATLQAHPPGRQPYVVTSTQLMLNHIQATPDGLEVIGTDYLAARIRIVAIRVDDGSVRELARGVRASVSPDGREVVVARGGEAGTLTAVPLHGDGAPRPLAPLGGEVLFLRVGGDGFVHAQVVRAGRPEAWRTPLAGGPAEREAPAPWCFVHPAPTGDVAVWMRCEPGVVGPFQSPRMTGVVGRRLPEVTAPGFGVLAIGDFDARGATYVYGDAKALQRLEVATGARTALTLVGVPAASQSPDGQTMYTITWYARVRRSSITNVADRPRLAGRAGRWLHALVEQAQTRRSISTGGAGEAAP